MKKGQKDALFSHNHKHLKKIGTFFYRLNFAKLFDSSLTRVLLNNDCIQNSVFAALIDTPIFKFVFSTFLEKIFLGVLFLTDKLQHSTGNI